MISKMQGKKVRIRPIPVKKLVHGRLVETDDLWLIETATKDIVRISNLNYAYSKNLGTDHIDKFQTDSQFGSDGFLILHSQLIMDGMHLHVEPLRR